MKKNHNTNPLKHYTHQKHLHQFIQNFFLCGFLGLFTEILFTAVNALKRRDFSLKGTTSLWMFPIYGAAAIIVPVSAFLHRKKTPACVRGILYTLGIFFVEFFSGKKLRRKKRCPWDYHRSRFHINGLIRLDFAPFWFIFGLFVEKFFSRT